MSDRKIRFMEDLAALLKTHRAEIDTQISSGACDAFDSYIEFDLDSYIDEEGNAFNYECLETLRCNIKLNDIEVLLEKHKEINNE